MAARGPQNGKFFDPSTASMRKGPDGEKKTGKGRGGKKKRLMIIVAITSLPAVDRLSMTAGTPHACAKRMRVAIGYA